MKTKDWLWPLVLIVSAVLVVVSLFVNFFEFEAIVGNSRVTGYATGIFADYSSYQNPTIATLTLISFIIGGVGILGAVLVTLLKIFKIKIAYRPINLACAILTLIGFIALFVFALIFMSANKDIPFMGSLIGQFGLYLALAGFLIGAIASFLSANDLHPRAKKSSTPKAKKSPKPKAKKSKRK